MSSAQIPQLRPNVDLHQLAINTIRTLAMDAVEKAKSGHPGTPMSMAPVAYTLWQHYLNYDPLDPLWMNRDRFVLSAGHASMLLYSLLHLSEVRAVNENQEVLPEVAIPMEEIKRFRQLGSKTPGHPEFRIVSGVEATTGPLGQGAANSVGMAAAELWLAATFNRENFEIFKYRIYALCSDGDMMEGISGEAASLAGHLKLNNLCWIYDRNKISIEGSTELAFTEDVGERFLAYGWDVLYVSDANDLTRLGFAFEKFKSARKPTLIIVDSHIAWGSPHKQDHASAHGEPLGDEEVALTKQVYGWKSPHSEKFYVPDEVRTLFRQGIQARGRKAHLNWTTLMANYREQYPELAVQLDQIRHGLLPEGWDQDLPLFPADEKGMAGREASGKVLNQIASKVPWLLGGAADLGPSAKTHLDFSDFESGSYEGRNFHFGVREHAMGGILNGLALSGLRPFGATFLIFSDYQRASLRLSAIMEINPIDIYTHDSIGLGEDGPTHQSIEQLASLRAMPNLFVLRPGDANEVTECWKLLMRFRKSPAALVLTRQKLPTLDRSKYGGSEGVQRGAYILADSENPEVILLGTGSELHLCVEAYEKLKVDGVPSRVVSMPSWEIFESQDESYREEVLPTKIRARVSVEAASSFGWSRYVSDQGISLGMTTFGASAPGPDVMEHFGFTANHVMEAALEVLRRRAF